MDHISDGFERLAASLIALAASLVDEPRKIWEYMQCSESDYLDYCAGRKVPTQQELERLIELIIREQGSIVTRNRERLSRAQAQDGKPDGAKTRKLDKPDA